MARKYTEQGQEVEVLQELGDGRFLVAYVMEYGYDDEGYVSDDPVVADRVFDEPPTAKLNAKVVELQDKIMQLQAERSDLAARLWESRDRHKKRLERYAQYDALQHLDSFIDGKITHYVTDIQWGPPDIKTLEETFGDFHGVGPRLLSLFGNSEGRLDWRLNRYKDDSGSWRVCIPCLSYDEAVVKLSEIMREKMAEDEVPSMRKIEVCDKYGIDVPAAYRAAAEEYRVATLCKRIAATRQKLAELEEQL